MNSNSNSTHASEIDPRVPGDVPQTLTALIAREKNPGMLFLTIKTLRENDVFVSGIDFIYLFDLFNMYLI